MHPRLRSLAVAVPVLGRLLVARTAARETQLRVHEDLALATAHLDNIHVTLDALGVPRQRHEQIFTIEERLGLFVDRLSERLHTQVENNMVLWRLCREVIVLLEGAPNSSQFRVRTSIEKLKAATTPSASPMDPAQRASAILLPS